MLFLESLFFLLSIGHPNLGHLLFLINHSMFPSQPLVPDSFQVQVPLVSAEFSPPLSSVDVAIPPDEFLDLVHPNQVASHTDHHNYHIVSSPNFLPDAPILASKLPALNTTTPAPVRRSNRPYNPPSYLHDYHYNLVSAHVLALASLTQSHKSTVTSNSGILYPLSSTLSYSKLSTPHRIFSVALFVAKEPNSYAQALKDPSWRAVM